MTSHLFFSWSHTPFEKKDNSLLTRTRSESETFEWLSSTPLRSMRCRTTSSTTTTTERSVTTCSRRLPIPILRLPHPTPIGPQPHQLSAEWKEGRKQAGKFAFNIPQDYYSNNGQIHTYQLLKRRKKWAERERDGSCCRKLQCLRSVAVAIATLQLMSVKFLASGIHRHRNSIVGRLVELVSQTVRAWLFECM